jgi:hypothetical protein
MNLLTRTLSPYLSVGTMLAEGIQNASTTNGLTKPKTSTNEMTSMTRNSRTPPPPFLEASRRRSRRARRLMVVSNCASS